MQEPRGILSRQEYTKSPHKVLYAGFIVLCSLIALVMIYPLIWVFMSSLKTPTEIFTATSSLLPASPQWDNFLAAWKAYQMPLMLANTLVVFLGFIVSRLLVIVLSSYALSKMEVPWRGGFYLFFLATLILPTFAYLIPSYLVINQLGLYDTWWALWLPAGANSMLVLMTKSFFDSIPYELVEAGRIDGASQTRVLRSLILPNAKPILAVISIFSFFDVWNNFFFARLVIVDMKKWTIPIMVWYQSFTIGGNPPMNIQLAGMCMTLVPPLILFAFFQKYITQGITLSGIKG